VAGVLVLHQETLEDEKLPPDTLAQVAAVLDACKQINPHMKAGAMTQEELAYELEQTRSIQAQINRLELQLTELRNRRDQRLTGIWENVKRARYTVKSAYGDDSSEHELVGGRRMSERKKSMRKQAASVAQAEN
jgi:hypothetical protein